MKIDLLSLCEALQVTLADKGNIDFLIGYLLYEAVDPAVDQLLERHTGLELVQAIARWASEATGTPSGQTTAVAGASQPVGTPSGRSRAVQGTQPQGGSQPFQMAQTGQGTPQSKAVLASARSADDVRVVVAVPGQDTEQGTRSAGETRALELLREGYSERRLLAQLKAEGLRLDKSKLKGLRAEV